MRDTTALLLLSIGQACAGAGQDLETLSSTTSGAPDITGAYEATFSEASGCDPAPPDVVTGPLDVAGLASDLTLSFAEGIVWSGQIDDTFSITLAGESSSGGFDLSVSGEGLAYIDAERWVLEVDLAMDVTDDSGQSCVQTGRLDALENMGGM